MILHDLSLSGLSEATKQSINREFCRAKLGKHADACDSLRGVRSGRRGNPFNQCSLIHWTATLRSIFSRAHEPIKKRFPHQVRESQKFYYCPFHFLKIKDVFTPPNAKLFAITVSQSILRPFPVI